MSDHLDQTEAEGNSLRLVCTSVLGRPDYVWRRTLPVGSVE